MKMKSSNVLIFICTLLLAAFCQSDAFQGPPPGLASAPKLPVLGGKIAEIRDDGLTIKTTQGESATVKVSAETRFRRDQKDAHLADFKIGDTVTTHVSSYGKWDEIGVRDGEGCFKRPTSQSSPEWSARMILKLRRITARLLSLAAACVPTKFGEWGTGNAGRTRLCRR